ncbi:hypothetical protein [Bacillus mycoides]|uniref:hypothetical protein n=1 Tax=Bacillus mycoides TaxID=1405 RepID=UPI001C015946|nr:hypothetical protein [Bacillus mycoides]QWG33346.1 hypothetical protein EXW30_10605 [Bacillus mycoides]
MKRLLTAILAGIILSSIFEAGNFITNGYSFSIMDIIMIAIIYIIPLYILFGIPVSIIIDRCTSKYFTSIKSPYQLHMIQLFVYALSGIFSFGLLLLILNPRVLGSAIFGFMPSILYFYIYLLLKRLG